MLLLADPHRHAYQGPDGRAHGGESSDVVTRQSERSVDHPPASESHLRQGCALFPLSEATPDIVQAPTAFPTDYPTTVGARMTGVIPSDGR
jgi:hypothetical protein